MTTSFTATLIGGPTLRFTYAGRTLLTDPTFDDPGEHPGPVTLRKTTPPALPADEAGPVDVVLLSHDQHADNLDVAGRAFLARVPLVLSTPLAASRVEGVVGLEPWQRTTLPAVPGRPSVQVTAVPAQHGPVGCEPVSGPVTGFVLQAEGEPTVYVSGDNASVEVVGAIAARFDDVRVAVLFVGAANVGRFGEHPVTLDALRALAVARLLPQAVVVPVHAEGWAHFTESTDELTRAFAGTQEAPRLHVPPRGVQVAIALRGVHSPA